MELDLSTVLPEAAEQLRLLLVVVDTFEDADVEIIKHIEYFDGWQSYEECGGILVFTGIDGSIQVCDYGHCVMADENTNHFEPREVTRDEADRLIAEMTKAAENSNNEY